MTTTNSRIFALLSAIAAVTAFVPVAEAGGGVRLGFGFPMGEFVATPRNGGSYSAPKIAKSKPKAYDQQTARAATESSPKVRVKTAKPVTETASTKTGSTDSDTADTEETGQVTGSTALIQTTTTAETTEPAAEVAATSTETKADEPKTEETKTDETEATEKTAEVKDDVCKKFVPALGVTVTVGCDK